MSLAALFFPRGIAIVGASENARKFGGLTLENVIAGGYEGNIVPVTPRDAVMGRKAYPAIADIPTEMTIDIVVVCVPKKFVPNILEETAAKKIPYLMVMSGGYGEQGAEGAQDEKVLVARARELGVRIIGPNLLGMASTPSKLLLNASLAMREVPRRVGGVSLVSQSGASMGVLFNRGSREGVRYQHVIALGNQSDLEISEIIRFYAEDPATKVVITSIEGLKKPGAFVEAVSACRAAGKPVIAMKAGRTSEGARVAATHTGSMASDYTGFAAKLESEGVILVQDEFSMMRLAAMYDIYGPAPATGGVALLSPSGGAIAQSTDRISEKGMRLATFDPQTVKKLETIYVPGLTSNPLDFANMHDNSFVDVGDGGAAIVADDPDVAAIVGVFGTAHNLDEMVTGIGGAVGRKKPVLFTVLPGNNGDKARAASVEMGFLALDSIEETIELVRLWMAGAPTVHPSIGRPADIKPVRLPATMGDATLGEFEAKQILAGYGIRVTREAKAATPDEAEARAFEIGFPVVLKGFGAKLVHKSEFGAVKLNLKSPEDVRAAWAEMAGRLGGDMEGCVVGEMVCGQVEVILGAFHSEDFGPMILIGAGGILAELVHDVAVLPAPAHPAAIREKLNGLKIAKLLHGFRGKPAADIDALVDSVHRLSHLVADHASQIAELDINPLIVGAVGKGAIAVDARIRLVSRSRSAAA